MRSQKYDEVQKLCSGITDNLSRVYTPLNTKNPVLNAIEYLNNLPLEQRYMSLKIFRKNDYSVITCENRADKNIFESNPEMKTSKEDKENHGKGIKIVEEIAKKYDGAVRFSNSEPLFTVSVLIKRQSLPKNSQNLP